MVYILSFSVFMMIFLKCKAFIPDNNYKLALENAKLFNNDLFGYVTETLTHEEIIERGVIQSAVKFFYDQPNGKELINLAKMKDYYIVKRLYNDYYGEWYCHLDLEDSIKVLRQNVVKVDAHVKTKDLPLAHFDAEKFTESNQRVKFNIKRILEELKKKNYKEAQKLSGRILHTIQDFYSHSNWVILIAFCLY